MIAPGICARRGVRFLCALALAFAWAPSAEAEDAAPACPAPARMSAQATAPLTLRFVGDIVLANAHVMKTIPRNWDSRYFAPVAGYLRGADASIGNLEGTLTDHAVTTKVADAEGRAFAFRSPPRYAAMLRDAGFRVMNLANNHADDFGPTGYADTLQALHQAGVLAAGVKGQIAILEIKGLKVAVLGFGFFPNQDRFQDLDNTRRLVRQARKQAQVVLVSFHSGATGAAALLHPDAEEQQRGENRGNAVAFARAAIDSGADVVVGHGPHVLRAIECYRGKPIFYSLGNFVGVGGLSIRGPAAVTAIAGVQLDAEGQLLGIEFLSVIFDARKIPNPDQRDFAAHLVNWAGARARYEGRFLQVPADPASLQAFEQWLASFRPASSGGQSLSRSLVLGAVKPN